MKRIPLISLAFGALLGLAGCTAPQNAVEELNPEKSNSDTERYLNDPISIKDYLRDLPSPDGLRSEYQAPGGLEAEPSKEPVETIEKKQGNVNGIPGFWATTKKHYKVSRLFSETILLDPNVDILYPGCVLYDYSVKDGSLAPADAQVGDVTISINKVVNGIEHAGESSKTYNNIRMSDYRKACDEWANTVWKKNAVTTTYSVEKVSSKAEAVFKIGATFKSEVVDVAGNFDFNYSSDRQRILAKFIQKAYSVSLSLPKSGTIFSQIDKKYLKHHQPVYVSNINYGRMLFMYIDTKYSLADVDEALSALVKKINLEVNQAAKYKKVLDDSRISVTIIGGSESAHAQVLEEGRAWEGLQKYISYEPEFAEAQPISFSLRYASDNSLARVQTTSEFDVTRRTFYPEFDKLCFEVNLDAINATGHKMSEPGKEYEVYGQAWITNHKYLSAEDLESKPFMTYFYESNNSNYISVKRGELKDVNGSKTLITINKPKNMTFEQFIRTRLQFKTHFSDSNTFKDTDYGTGEQDLSIHDILAISNSEDGRMKISSNGKGSTIDAYIKISGVYYVASDGQKIDLPEESDGAPGI